MTELSTRIVGIGQPAAGDDGVGIVVAETLGSKALPANVEIITLADPAQLIEHLEGVERIILIDAVVSTRAPGHVDFFTIEDLTAGDITPISSHSMNIVQSIQLARTLSPAKVAQDIRVVGISIAPPDRYSYEMSTEVTTAIPKAVTLLQKFINN